jgi:hypothetical protein
MKKPLIFSTLSLLVFACVSSQAEPIEKSFDAQYFVGLDTPETLDYDNSRLDYELDSIAGKAIQFQNCGQVETTKDSEIVESQYALYKMLRANCLALKKYSQGKNAQKSYLPDKLQESTVSSFPATAVPKMNDEDLKRRAGNALSQYEKNLKLSTNPDGAIVAMTSTDEMQYYLLATGDFNNDQIQDFLVRVDWRTLNAFGSGSDLFIVTKTSKTAPLELVWRM